MIVRALGSRPVSGMYERLNRGRLRVLAFHDVPDERAFDEVLDVIAQGYTTVSGEQVTRWLAGCATLPDAPVWLTFDDGRADVVSTALPLLHERSMVATLFICPGIVEQRTPYWWDVARRAAEHGILDESASELGSVATEHQPISGAALVSRLKATDDGERRRVVAALDRRLGEHGIVVGPAHATSDQIDTWVAHGQELGNHSWDHPCLDRCRPDEARDQVRRAHDWFEARGLGTIDVFAWPNGNRCAAAHDELVRLGYRALLGFDHRINLPTPRTPVLSRLRIDADARPSRVNAILSGAHSSVFHFTNRFRLHATGTDDAT